MMHKKIAINSEIFSLPQIPSHPVSTAGGGIKRGWYSLFKENPDNYRY
jgi:hypothetical protein